MCICENTGAFLLKFDHFNEIHWFLQNDDFWTFQGNFRQKNVKEISMDFFHFLRFFWRIMDIILKFLAEKIFSFCSEENFFEFVLNFFFHQRTLLRERSSKTSLFTPDDEIWPLKSTNRKISENILGHWDFGIFLTTISIFLVCES